MKGLGRKERRRKEGRREGGKKEGEKEGKKEREGDNDRNLQFFFHLLLSEVFGLFNAQKKESPLTSRSL